MTESACACTSGLEAGLDWIGSTGLSFMGCEIDDVEKRNEVHSFPTHTLASRLGRPRGVVLVCRVVIVMGSAAALRRALLISRSTVTSISLMLNPVTDVLGSLDGMFYIM